MPSPAGANAVPARPPAMRVRRLAARTRAATSRERAAAIGLLLLLLRVEDEQKGPRGGEAPRYTVEPPRARRRVHFVFARFPARVRGDTTTSGPPTSVGQVGRIVGHVGKISASFSE